MPSTARPAADTNPQDVARFSVAGTFLEAIADRDFALLATTLTDDVRLRALLPGGPIERRGPDAVDAAFHGWFDDYDGYEMIDAAVGEVGTKLHLRWRLRVRTLARSDRWLVVEQQAYVDTRPGAGIADLSLLCSGFCQGGSDA